MITIKPITSDADTTPTICIICCFQGDAFIIKPVFKSCILSPPIAAEQHTTEPMSIDNKGPNWWLGPFKAKIIRLENIIVAIVTPDIGLFEDPTTPAIYAATDEKIKAINIIRNDKKIDKGRESTS